MIFVDSSVLVPNAVVAHVNHKQADLALAQADPRTHATAAHCLAELYSQLTGKRYPRLVSPAIAAKTVEAFANKFTVVTLTALESLAAITGCARTQVAGGTVYDALIVACARKIDASSILTYNIDDFVRAAPDLADIIREP